MVPPFALILWFQVLRWRQLRQLTSRAGCRLTTGLVGWCLAVGTLAGQAQPLTGPAGPTGWQAEAGLRGQRVQAIAQAPGQPIWLATDEGVYRYDGPGRLIPLNELRRGGLELPPVLCHLLLLTPDGALWLGTTAGAFRFDSRGELQAVPLPAPEQTPGDISCLVLAPDGRHLWVGQQQVGVRRFTLAGQPAGPLVPERTLLLEAWPAPDGTLWLTTQPGRTSCYAPTGRRLNSWDAYPLPFVRPVAEPGTGRVWLLGAGRLYQPGPAGRLLPGPSWRAGPPTGFHLLRQDSILTVVLLDSLLELKWARRSTGGLCLRPRRAILPPPAAPRVFRQALTWPVDAHLWADPLGRWWYFTTSSRGAWTRSAAPAFIQALPGPAHLPYSVRGLHRLPDGRLLVSTYGGPLVQAADSPLAPLRSWPYAAPSRANFQPLMGLVPARVGPPGHADWLAASDHEFLRFDPHTNRLVPLPTLGIAGAIPAPLALVREPPPSRRVWGAASAGLFVYDSAAAAFRPYYLPGTVVVPFAHTQVEDVCPDGQGHLWLATPGGVVCLTVATGARVLVGLAAPAEPRRVSLGGVRCLWLDQAAQRLWVGSRTQGLYAIDLRTQQAQPVLTTANGLPNAHVASILPGPGGTLWLGTYAGLVRYQPASGTVAVFTTADGLSSDEFNAGAVYADPADHSLLLGGVAGLHRLAPPPALGPGATRPRLLLTAVAPLRATESGASGRPQYQLATDALPALALGPSQPVLDLHLLLADYLDAGQSRFAYRLNNWLDGRWLPLGTTPLLRLQGLPPGRYIVEIRGETSRGVPAANTLRLSLTVTAEWWRRPITWMLAAGLLGGLLWYWQHRRLQRQRRDYARRARLAADLHDEVGALLTRVTMQAELLQARGQAPPARLAALVQDTRAAASTVRDIIWSVDAAADTLASLVDRIRDLLDATARATGRAVQLNDTGLPPDLARPLPALVRQHVYLICKEAVTNALRHGSSTASLTVSLHYGTGYLELYVWNDGTSVPVSTRAGQGLRNMRERAHLLHGTLTVGPCPGGGWQVKLRTPL